MTIIEALETVLAEARTGRTDNPTVAELASLISRLTSLLCKGRKEGRAVAARQALEIAFLTAKAADLFAAADVADG